MRTQSRDDFGAGLPARVKAANDGAAPPHSSLTEKIRRDVTYNVLASVAESLLQQVNEVGADELSDESGLTLDEKVRRYEIGLIKKALISVGGNQRKAARLLGVKPTTLNTKINAYKVNGKFSMDELLRETAHSR